MDDNVYNEIMESANPNVDEWGEISWEVIKQD